MSQPSSPPQRLTRRPTPTPPRHHAQVRNPHLIQAFMADLIDSKVLSGPGAISSRPTAVPTSGLAPKQSPLFSASSSIAASVGSAVGVTPAAVTAAELETDFARLDLATGACELQRRDLRVAWPLTLPAAPCFTHSLSLQPLSWRSILSLSKAWASSF